MIYLDNNSTTQCAPEVVSAILPFLSEYYANPSSPHTMGRKAKAATDSAREQLARLLDCLPTEIIFTSGATESNNLVLLGVEASDSRHRIVTSSIEHKSVLEPCAYLERAGQEIRRLPVDTDGRISLNAATKVITDESLLVSIQAANNEVGTIQAIAELAGIAHQHGALFHCDATQALGKIPFSLRDTGVDFASFSGHKVYAPKGIGVLFVRSGFEQKLQRPLCRGGRQEGGVRPGTLNVPGIVGFGKAAELVISNLGAYKNNLRKLQEVFETEMLASGLPVTFNGSRDEVLPGTISLTILGVPSDMLVANLHAVCISNGSACTAGTMSPSHVLLAMGMSREHAECTVRIGIGRYNTKTEIIHAAKAIANTAIRLKDELGEHATVTTFQKTGR